MANGSTGDIQFFGTSYKITSGGALTVASCSGCSGSVAFSGITAGTNTAALVVGTGGSLTTSGSGTITATDLGCADCVALTTETSGNYVASITNGTGISGGNGGSEGAALTLSIDQAASLTWTGSETFNNNVLIGVQSDSTPSLGPSSFTIANTSSTAGCYVSGCSGSGNAGIDGAFSSAEYKGKLYVSTKETDASAIYRYDGSNVWTRVSDSTAGKIISGDLATIDYSTLAVYNGKLIAASANGASCTASTNCSALYTYDGTTWSLLSTTRGTYGATTLQLSATDLQVCGGKLYVATTGTAATNTALIYRMDSGVTGSATFTQISFGAGKFSVTGETAVADGYVMTCYGGHLIAGEQTGSAGNLGRVEKFDGNIFQIMNTSSTTTGGTFGAETNMDDVDSLMVYDGQLYAGVGEPNLAGIYVYKGSLDRPTTPAAGTDWLRVTSTQGRIDSASDATDIDHIPVMRQYNGRLYAGSDTSAAGNLAGVYEYDPTIQSGAAGWTIKNSAAGTPAANRGAFGSDTGIDKVDTLLELNGTLYVGTEDSAGNNGSIYTWTKTVANSYGLRFDSGSSNYGAISFAGNVQAGDNNGHMGSFLFSNPVNLGGGAFDYAEDYPTFDNSLVAGDPVAVDSASPDHVRQAKAGDSILGVVSANPGMRLSTPVPLDGGDRYVPIALVGRVPAKVTTLGGSVPINAGDKLSLSASTGVLQKSLTAGDVVGTALESYDAGENGQIDVFINPGWNGNFASLGNDSQQTYTIGGLQIASNDSTSLKIVDQLGKSVVSFDSSGNATFAGTITADKVKANQIEGLEILTDKISSLQAKLAENKPTSTQTQPATNGTPDSGITNAANVNFGGIQAVNLVVLAQIESRGGLVVDKEALFNGKTIFALLAQFNGDAEFNGNTAVNGQITLNNDHGGTAVIKTGDKRVSVKFAKDYPQAPIVVASWAFVDSKDASGNIVDPAEAKQQRLTDGSYSYFVTNVTTKGFDIVLNKNATEDWSLSWLATSVKDAVISQSASGAN